jgi:hypothetical protein
MQDNSCISRTDLPFVVTSGVGIVVDTVETVKEK